MRLEFVMGSLTIEMSRGTHFENPARKIFEPNPPEPNRRIGFNRAHPEPYPPLGKRTILSF